MQITERDTTLDIAKGISILLMTFSHLTIFFKYEMLGTFNKEVLMLFKMPLFIFISGYLFTNKLTFKDFSLRKWNGLMKPTLSVLCFLTATILLFFIVVLKKPLTMAFLSDFYNKIIDLFTGLWFPISLFFSLLLFKFLIDCKQKYSSSVFIAIGLCVIFFLGSLHFANIWLFLFKANTFILFLWILYLGFQFKLSTNNTVMYRPYFFILSLVLFVLLVYNKVDLDIKLDLYSNVFGNVFFTTLTFLSGISCVLFLSNQLSRLKYISSIFIACSRASFFILAFHILIGNNILYKIYLRFFTASLVWDSVLFTLTILLCIGCYKISLKNKYLKRFLLP